MDPIAITDISLQNLGELLLNNLNSPTYPLTPEQQSIFQNFIQSSPSVFDKLSVDILAITKDGKIDLYDIPVIFQLFIDTYSLHTLLSCDNIIVFIQYTLDVIIDSKFVVLPYYEKEVLDTVIHSCIQLLKTNITPIPKSWRPFFYCF